MRTNQPAALERLEPYLPMNRRRLATPVVDALYSLWVADPQAGSRVRQLNVAYSGILRLSRDSDLKPSLVAIEADLVYRVAAGSRRVFVKAGVVGWGDGALLIVGESGTGKSYLVRSLVEAGGKYFSDRCAVLDETGRVHPYPTEILAGSGPGNECQRIAVPKAWTAHRSMAVKAIVVTEFRPHTEWRVRHKSPGQALLTLLQHALPTRNSAEATLKTLKAVVSHSDIYFGARGEAEEMARRLAELYGGLRKASAGKLKLDPGDARGDNRNG